MSGGLEPIIARVLAQAGQKLLGSAMRRGQRRRLRDETRTLVPTRVVEGLLAELDAAEARGIDDYLGSPDFEEVALQYVLSEYGRQEELRADIRHEIHHGLRNIAGLRPALLVTATDVVFDALTAAGQNWTGQASPAHMATAAHLTAAAAANSRLLREVGDLARVHDFARDLRTQVAAVHGHMRLPHLGESRSVPYDQLYVPPVLRPEQEGAGAPDPGTLALPGRQTVILGDPGAGKSTLAAKLAHDVATDRVPGAEGRVPFLLVLREFAGSFRDGGTSLVRYLEQVCRAPYNLEPPPKAVEYLLGNGRAVVLLDGLDELVEPELRRRFVELVYGFVSRFPLLPIVVTARRIGYSEVPLPRHLFGVGVIAELSDEQVEQYAERWFALDASTVEADRARLAKSFVAESRSIADLRANPLLLALLCAMYSSEHYLPTNLAEVYERCSGMLFDRWDRMRGIGEAPRFQGRLRAAVQHLAWQLFTAEEPGTPLPRHRIVRLLAEYLIGKRFDEDEAVATAETFVEFCTGRTWVLTDVGATETEPRYGFSHRTFLEFFAAEHLVRTRPTAELLWAELRPQVLADEWEVVAQIALQLLDRNVDGGADDLLRLVLAEGADAHGFATRALGHVHPGHDVIRDVTIAALNDTLAPEVAARHDYWPDFNALRIWDGALHTLMYGCSPGNLPVVHRTVKTVLGSRVKSGNEAALYAVMNLGRHLLDADRRTAQLWGDTRRALLEQYEAELDMWRERAPWADIHDGAEPERVIARFGVWPLYVNDLFLTGSLPSIVERLLDGPADDRNPAYRPGLCEALLAAPRPWISDQRWWLQPTFSYSGWSSQHERLVNGRAWNTTRLLPFALVYLPYLETHAHLNEEPVLPPNSPLVHRLFTARMWDEVDDLERELWVHSVPEEVQDFLVSWARREFDLVSPPEVSGLLPPR